MLHIVNRWRHRGTYHFATHSGLHTTRWHVRADCEHADSYRDFVLSRINGVPDINDNAASGKQDDGLWDTDVTIELIPALHFNEKQ